MGGPGQQSCQPGQLLPGAPGCSRGPDMETAALHSRSCKGPVHVVEGQSHAASARGQLQPPHLKPALGAAAVVGGLGDQHPCRQGTLGGSGPPLKGSRRYGQPGRQSSRRSPLPLRRVLSMATPPPQTSSTSTTARRTPRGFMTAAGSIRSGSDRPPPAGPGWPWRTGGRRRRRARRRRLRPGSGPAPPPAGH